MMKESGLFLNNCDFLEDEIDSIEEKEDAEEIYDISLLESDFILNEPNYIANDFIVHNSNMHTSYAKRKQKQEFFEIHPLLKPVLEKTYGVMCYQEQVMQILNVVGSIPLTDCYAVCKAISKKKIEGFAKYKELFIINGIKNLGLSSEDVTKIWEQLEAFAGYGFNKCLSGDSIIFEKNTQEFISIIELKKRIEKESLCLLDSFCEDNIVEDEVLEVFSTGEQDIYEIELDNGMVINTTMEHKFLCDDYIFYSVWEILKYGKNILYDDTILAYDK